MSEDTPSKAGEPGDSNASGETDSRDRRRLTGYVVAIVLTALATAGVVWLLTNIFERRHEAQVTTQRVVDVDESTTDPAVWGKNWPHQYESYQRTVDYERTRYGGSDAIPRQKLDMYPWLRLMWSGYAFSIDYREARGHAYMLIDQEETRRVTEREQPGACLHCHSSVIPAYREVGNGDVMEGFREVSGMSYEKARNLTGEDGEPLIEHPASCVDCHDPETMDLRVTRPAFLEGIADLKEHEEGVEDYDVNRDATRQEMRTYVCGQCHVEYYFRKEDTAVTYPWANGLEIENVIDYYDEIDFSDWTHGYTGAPMLKAQHPEFELYSQGTHAQAGVACADCHMPYKREGAMKVSDHHVRSPLLNIPRACQTCHNVPEDELRQRAHRIQDRTSELIDRAAVALEEMMHETVAARESGTTDEELDPVLELQREAQFRLDYIFSENSHGFHADQESAKILAEAIDYARQGRAMARELRTVPVEEIQTEPAPVQGVTEDDELAPPGPYNRPGVRQRPTPDRDIEDVEESIRDEAEDLEETDIEGEPADDEPGEGE
ncbi:MAG: ammonia-forming cytochrome c nitrite reductase subunit c552 [Persicimonas sp.]